MDIGDDISWVTSGGQVYTDSFRDECRPIIRDEKLQVFYGLHPSLINDQAIFIRVPDSADLPGLFPVSLNGLTQLLKIDAVAGNPDERVFCLVDDSFEPIKADEYYTQCFKKDQNIEFLRGEQIAISNDETVEELSEKLLELNDGVPIIIRRDSSISLPQIKKFPTISSSHFYSFTSSLQYFFCLADDNDKNAYLTLSNNETLIVNHTKIDFQGLAEQYPQLFICVDLSHVSINSYGEQENQSLKENMHDLFVLEALSKNGINFESGSISAKHKQLLDYALQYIVPLGFEFSEPKEVSDGFSCKVERVDNNRGVNLVNFLGTYLPEDQKEQKDFFIGLAKNLVLSNV